MMATAAPLFQPQPDMTLHSDLLGTLEVDAEELIEFPVGLFGFPECRRFIVVATERDGFLWLQSADHSALVFLLVDPFLHFPGYAVDLPTADLHELDATEAADVAIFAIVTLPASREEQPTANLQGPIAFNFKQHTAKQLAISESEFGVRSPFRL